MAKKIKINMKKQVGRILAINIFDGGFSALFLRIFRLAFMVSYDKHGDFIQFNFGIWKLGVTIQFSIDT